MKNDKKKRVYIPEKQMLKLNKTLLPDIDNIDVGSVTTITLKVKMISKSEGNEYGGYELGCCDGDNVDATYEAARKADQNQMKGKFEVLAAEEDEPDTADTNIPAAKQAADKIMATKRRGRMI